MPTAKAVRFNSSFIFHGSEDDVFTLCGKPMIFTSWIVDKPYEALRLEGRCGSCERVLAARLDKEN